jgi:hypothetical protein
MRRSLLFVAVVLVASSWSGTAFAQFSFGETGDPNAEIEAARSTAKQNLKKYSSRPSGGSTAARSKIGSSFLDTYGRRDLAGHAVPGYPAARGDLSSASVSRGGANGKARRSAKPRPNANRPR